MSNAKLQAAREFILSEQYDTARAILSTMKASSTAQKWLAKINEIAPAEGDEMHPWEYQEIFVKAADQLPQDVAQVIDDRRFTTVDHFYTRLLNQYGAEGWELVSEDLHGGDVVRLLFKRPAQNGAAH